MKDLLKSKMMNIPESTLLAIRHLIQQAAEDGVTVAGFAFSADPACLAGFGNCSDHEDIKLFEELCGMTAEKRRAGNVIVDLVEKPV